MYPLMVVNLPEDDTSVLGATEAVAVGSVTQLPFGQIASRDHGLTELGIHGERPLDDV
jgi:hypothetical protein